MNLDMGQKIDSHWVSWMSTKLSNESEDKSAQSSLSLTSDQYVIYMCL